MDDCEEKIEKYENFLSDVLYPDLTHCVLKRDKLSSKLAEYTQLKTIILRIQDIKKSGETFRTKVDLGCNFFCQAEVDDLDTIYVCIGADTYLAYTYAEALEFINNQDKLLSTAVQELRSQAAMIRARIQLILQGIRQLKELKHTGDQE